MKPWIGCVLSNEIVVYLQPITVMERKKLKMTSRDIRDILHLEIVMKRILLMLDIDTLDHLLTGFELHWHFQDNKLWSALLKIHFGGEQNDVQTLEINDKEPEKQRDIEEINDQQHLVIKFGDPEVDEMEIPLPVWLCNQSYCVRLLEFVHTKYHFGQFMERVYVVKGNIGTITEINGIPIDSLAFSTSSHMFNPRTGVAGVVFRRAGIELDAYIREMQHANYSPLHVGEARKTPGFNTGMRCLIHCHGPRVGDRNCEQNLAFTYRSALEIASRENLTCVAIASISTGNFGVPLPLASRVGMKTFQYFIRTRGSWRGVIGIVCFEDQVYQAFVQERNQIIHAFNRL